MNYRALFYYLLLATAFFSPGQTSARATGVQADADDPTAMTVNGQAVSAREYALVMTRRMAEVRIFFKEHHNLDDHADFWKDTGTRESPFGRLHSKVKEELIRIKIIQGLAKEKGLIEDTSYAFFRESFLRENQRRTQAVKANEVIYGPRRYRETTYYYICFGNLNHRLEQVLAKDNKSHVTTDDIKDFYDKNRHLFGEKTLADVREKIVEFVQEKQHENLIDTLTKTAVVEMNPLVINELGPRADR